MSVAFPVSQFLNRIIIKANAFLLVLKTISYLSNSNNVVQSDLAEIHGTSLSQRMIIQLAVPRSCSSRMQAMWTRQQLL